MAISGVSHVSITVSDLDKSAQWYQHVLGWVEQFRDRSDTTRFAFGRLPGDVALVLRVHDAPLPGPFDERRAGLDHLSFTVDTKDLELIAKRLEESGSKPSAIVDLEHAQVLSFRDPDNIGLELFAPSARNLN